MTKFRWLDLDAVPSEKLETIAERLQLVTGVCFILWLGTDVASRVLAPVSYVAEAFVVSWWWSAGAVTVITSLLLALHQLARHIDRRAGRPPVTLREVITAARQRTAYRYAVIFVFLAPLLCMRFVDDLAPQVVDYALDICLVLIAVMYLFRPPGGLLSLLERDGDRS